MILHLLCADSPARVFIPATWIPGAFHRKFLWYTVNGYAQINGDWSLYIIFCFLLIEQNSEAFFEHGLIFKGDKIRFNSHSKTRCSILNMFSINQL